MLNRVGTYQPLFLNIKRIRVAMPLMREIQPIALNTASGKATNIINENRSTRDSANIIVNALVKIEIACME